MQTYTEDDRTGIHDCHGQKPSESLELWLVCLGDECTDCVIPVKEQWQQLGHLMANYSAVYSVNLTPISKQQ